MDSRKNKDCRKQKEEQPLAGGNRSGDENSSRAPVKAAALGGAAMAVRMWNRLVWFKRRAFGLRWKEYFKKQLPPHDPGGKG